MKRRDFIKGGGVLGVAIVIPVLTKKKQLHLSGYIHDQTYYIDEPIVIDTEDTVVKYCRFVATRPLPWWIEERGNFKRTRFDSCRFEAAYI